MSERFNNDLERLLADKLDGDLTPTDAERLRGWLEHDERARREDADLERVDRLVRAWGRQVPDADWSSFRCAVSDSIRRDGDGQDERTRIYRLAPGSGRRPSARRWFILVPLAAAAVIAIATLPRLGTVPQDQTPIVEAPAKPAVEVAFNRPTGHAAPAPAVKVVVEFHRSEDLDRSMAARDAAGLAAPSMGVASGGSGGSPVPTGLPLFPI